MPIRILNLRIQIFSHKKNCCYLHLQYIRKNKQTQYCESLGFVDSGFVLASDELVLTPVRGTVGEL